MTTQQSTDAAPVESLADPHALRDCNDVPFHEDGDVVGEETFETVADLDDMAIVGVTRDDGRVLVTRITDTCDPKLPSAAVADDEDFVDAARDWVGTQAGIDVVLEAVVGVWHHEVTLSGSDRTATRTFVVYGASPAESVTDPEAAVADRPDDAAVEAGWFEELPDDAVGGPGTGQFFN